MTTTKFNRGISDDFVSALNGEYRKGAWWRNLVDDQETFLPSGRVTSTSIIVAVTF